MLMKNNFLSKAYGGVTVARRKLNGLGLHRQWKVMTLTLLLLFTFAIGNVWAQTFRYYIAISNADATGISSGAVRVFKTSDDVNFVNVSDQFTLNSEYSTSSAGSVYYYPSSKTYTASSGDGAIFRAPRYTKNKTFTINWTNTNLSFSKISFAGVGTNSGTKTITVKNSSTDTGSAVQFPKSTTIDTYECTKNFTQTNGITLVSANDQPAYAITILHAFDHAEITSTETEMVTSESLQMEAWPAGGTWSIAEGGTGTGSITSAGVLTASANGTIKVKYAKDGYGEDIKTITVSDSRTIHWFAAGNTDAATNEVSNNTSFFSFNTTSTSDQSGNITIGSKTYSLTKRLNAEQTTWSFTIPSNTTGTLNVVAISSGGSDRTLTMQKAGESGTVELGSTTNQKNAWSLITKVDIPAGTYTVSSDGNVRFGMMRMIINKTEPAVVGAYTVTAATSTGTNTYGTVSAGASSLDATETTTITASPATGYRVTNWAVADEDHGASIDPAGESNSNTTTLTMGTANATVTVTFGLIDYTVSKTLTNCAVKDGSTAIPATMNYGDDLSTIIEPITGNILPSSISVTGVTSYTWNASTGALTLTDVTGNVSISIEAAAPQTGSGTITYALVTSGETAATYSAGTFTGILSSGTPSLNTLGASNTLTGGNGVGVQSDKNTPKSSRTAGVTSSTADFNAASSPYAEFTFSVLDGYTFTPTAISVPVLAISNNAYFTAIVTDGSSTWTSATAECTQGAQAYINAAPSGGSALTGTVNIRVFCHNQATAAKGFRFGTGSVTITGTVVAAGACTPPTIAWDGDQPADAYVSDGSKTFKVTSNYTDGVALELSENTCGATIAVKSGSDNKQWVVSFTGAGSVKVTPKVVGDGSTVCATTVSAAAKTLTVTLAHDVTFNMNGHGAEIAKQVVADGGKVTAPYVADVADWVFGGWFTDAECTAGNEFDFANTTITADRQLYAKWTADACAGDRKSLSKVVLTSASDGTVTGYNGNEYAGEKVIGGLSSTETAEVDASHAGTETGYKLNDGGSAIVFATLKKGTFQEGDKVVVTITKKQDSYKIESVSQPVLHIYYGTNASDATKLTTLEGVSAAGSYTYRLTAADVAAIGEKKGIGVFRESSNGQNPYVYSVEITGCRVWTETHTVTYNKMGKGADVAPAVVAVGDLVPKPSVVEPDGWALAGWYKEEGLVNEWNFATDVMPDNNLTLYAKWESEEGVIKLFSNTGVLNTTNFVSAAKDPDGVNISAVNYPCLVAFGSNRTSLAGAAQADVVQYNATTNKVKIKLDLYNTNGSAKTAYLWMVEEGATVSGDPIEINVPGNTRVTTSYTSFDSEKPRSFYVTSGAKSDIKVLQVKVLDNGTAIPQFGKAGYAVNLNKGRIIAAANGTIPFDGATMHSNDAYTVLNSSNFKPKTYIQFNNAVANTTVRITKASSNAYYVTNDLNNKGTSYTTDQEVVLTTTGPWYIGSVNSGSVAAFSAIEFIAPKCETPAFNALANSNICSGDPYVALDGTGTVSDGGTITYKWYAQGSETVLATTATYTPTADGSYYVKALHHVDNYTDNEATSAVVTVTTHAGTVISEPLVDLRGAKDAVVKLTVTASGKNLSYAWKESATIDGTYTDVAGAADENELNVTITEGMDKYYKVIVHSDCGADQESVAHVTQFVPVSQQDVTASIVWDWSEAASGNTDEMKANTTPVRDTEFIMANGDARIYNNANFWSDKLVISGQFAVRGGNYFQGGLVKFHTTVPGVVRVEFSHTGTATADKPARELFINGVGTGATTANTTRVTTAFIDVPAGDVSITAQYIDPTKPGNQYVRVYKVEFYALAHQRTTGYNAGDLGTVCLEDATFIEGANLYELAGLNENGYLAFDQITTGNLEAGKPYLFEVTNPSKISFYKPVGAAHTDTEEAHKGMIGTFSGTTLSQGADNLYYFSGRHIWKVNDFTVAIPIPDHRCYVDYDAVQAAGPSQAPAAGRRRVTLGVQGKGTATDINNVEGDNVQPVKMLINGQLFILRGDKMYDAKGQLVK